MTDLLNFDDDDDNLFKPQEQQSKPSRSLDDIFGTNSDTSQPANSLDDILTPAVQDDIFETKGHQPKKTTATNNVDSLFGDDVDNEPDFFSGFDPKPTSTNISNPLEDDLLSDFLTAPVTVNKTSDPFDDLFGGGDHAEESSDDFNELFGTIQSEPVSQTVSQSELSNQSISQPEQSNQSISQPEQSNQSVSQPEQSTHPIDQSRRRTVSDDMQHDESVDSLDMLLDAQPLGTVPSCDDLLSLVERADTNTATSSNMSVPQNTNKVKDSPPVERDPLDDFFGAPGDKPEGEEPDNSKLLDDPEEVSDNQEDSEDKFQLLDDQEDSKPDTEQKPITKPKTNLKKSMERSFEDLLNGLSDESEPELDDMIVSDIDNTNLESLLESPNKSVRDTKQEDSIFTTPRKPVALDITTSTPMEKSDTSPEVKATAPEVKVHTPEDEVIDQEELPGERDETNMFDDEVVMRPKKKYEPESVDGDDLNLEAIEDTNHLDVDVSKHKSALGKTGSMALRRKPSRKSRKSLLSTGDDAIFKDSTDSRPVDLPNGNDEDLNGDIDDNYDLSPPAKKPSPAIMMPLPGLAGRPPSHRLSASIPDDSEDNAMDTKETKRLSKPPPGAFVLPSFGSRPTKLQSSPGEADKPSVESKPTVFEKPALRSVKRVEKSPSPESDGFSGFSRDGLRSTERQEADKKTDEEKDVTFQKPSLRSTPKPTRERTPEEKMDIGVFEKPALKSTPKPKFDSDKPLEEKESDVFVSRNLRSVDKRETDTVKDKDSDNHVFDKPSLRSMGRRLGSEGDSKKEISSTKTFDKPALRTTNKDLRSDSLKESSDHSHTFDKPALRSSSRTAEGAKPDSFTHGTFDKPSLKKATPSPEKETKEVTEPKGTFDRPALRKTGVKEKDRPAASDKPDWLQQAANKQSKVLEIMHTKENHQGHAEKEVPSWLEKSQLKKARTQPLQDTSNSQSASSSQSDLSNVDDTGKLPTPRSRNSSVSSEKETERKRTASTTKEIHNNYTPSWMRQNRPPSVPSPGVLGPTKSLPSLINSNEVPQWKRELAQRRANRKEKSPEESSKKEESVEPDWKKGIALRKTRNTVQPSKEVKSVEPEWKKAAEEKHARLRTSSVHEKTDQSGQS